MKFRDIKFYGKLAALAFSAALGVFSGIRALTKFGWRILVADKSIRYKVAIINQSGETCAVRDRNLRSFPAINIKCFPYSNVIRQAMIDQLARIHEEMCIYREHIDVIPINYMIYVCRIIEPAEFDAMLAVIEKMNNNPERILMEYRAGRKYGEQDRR